MINEYLKFKKTRKMFDKKRVNSDVLYHVVKHEQPEHVRFNYIKSLNLILRGFELFSCPGIKTVCMSFKSRLKNFMAKLSKTCRIHMCHEDRTICEFNSGINIGLQENSCKK